MFDHTCPVCGTHELVFIDRVRSVTNTDHGIVVEFLCTCGTTGHLVTGKHARARRDVVPSAA